MRQVVLDTETTGLEWEQGHRIIEIGCVELVNRRKTEQTFHCYLQPDREIDAAAEEIHGLSNEMLADKPLFADIAEDFLRFINGAELVIHNATFDVGFLNHELKLASSDRAGVEDICTVLDTLILARQLHPGQRNSLDALCKRYNVDNSRRDLHGALLDARLLADVYLAMTGGQATLSLGDTVERPGQRDSIKANRIDRMGLDFKVLYATERELIEHESQLDLIENSSEDGVLWRRLDS
ncbi:MAG: DNA polymerase III subunit epsilon [Gammaproteobacteria bacterium]|nr:DNA polymerase III subunit epsilon [Gammaproteobacteria bacterium]